MVVGIFLIFRFIIVVSSIYYVNILLCVLLVDDYVFICKYYVVLWQKIWGGRVSGYFVVLSFRD